MQKVKPINLPPNALDWIIVAVILSLQAIVVFQNFSGAFDIVGEDYGLNYFFPEVWSELSVSAWDPYPEFGKVTITSTSHFIWANAIQIFSSVGITPWALPRIVYCLFFGSTHLFCYFFLREHFLNLQSKEFSKSAILTGAFFGSSLYTFSWYTASLLHHPIYAFHFFIPILPGILFLWERSGADANEIRQIAIVSLLILILLNGNLAHSLIILCFVLTHACSTVWLINNYSPKRLLRFVFWGSSLCLILTLHYWLPMAFYSFNGINFSNPYGDVANSLDSFIYNSRRSSIQNILLGNGYPWFDSFDYEEHYSSSKAVNLSSPTLLFLSLICLLFRADRQTKIYWFAVMLAALFLSKGINQPIKEFWTLLLDHFSFVGMFRATFNKFWILGSLSIAVLFGISISHIWSTQKSKVSLSIILFSLAALIYLDRFPFFSGQLLLADFKARVPSEIANLNISKKSEPSITRVLFLPASPRGAGTIHSWPNSERFVGPNILRFFSIEYVDAAWFIKKGYFATDNDDWWEGIGLELRLSELLHKAEGLGINTVYIQKDGFNVVYLPSAPLPLVTNTRLKAELSISYLASRPDYELISNTKYFNIYKKQGYQPSKIRVPHFYKVQM